jgi:hypothetical protein
MFHHDLGSKNQDGPVVSRTPSDQLGDESGSRPLVYPFRSSRLGDESQREGRDSESKPAFTPDKSCGVSRGGSGG